MCPLFVALELSRAIKAIEAGEIHFKELYYFDYSEILSDLKFIRIEALESFIRTEWSSAETTTVPICNKYITSNH